MTHLRLRNENFSEHFEVTTQADSPINYALIAMAQEVTELLKQAYPVQAEPEHQANLSAACRPSEFLDQENWR